MNKWDLRFATIAKEVASWSKDPSAKVGSVAVDDQKRILATGYNGFPRGMDDDPSRYLDKKVKHTLVVHAEANVVYNASWNGTSLEGATLYVYGLPTCNECAKAIVQAGIKKVVVAKYSAEIPERWQESWGVTRAMFDEVGIEYEELYFPI